MIRTFRARVAEHIAAIDGPDPIGLPVPGPPPVPGAQWDELRGRWIRWMAGEWHDVSLRGEHPVLGDAIEDVVLPATLAHDLHIAHLLDLEREEVVIDLTMPEPVVRVDGAQWNEVRRRWEEWDDDAEAWVKAAAPVR